MNTEIFSKYPQLKKQIVEPEDQLDELKLEVTEELKTLPAAQHLRTYGASRGYGDTVLPAPHCPEITCRPRVRSARPRLGS
jgi:hypothetical protein